VPYNYQNLIPVLVFALVLVSGCGTGTSPEHEQAFEFLCGAQSQATTRNAVLAKTALDNYSMGRIESAQNIFRKLHSRGCEGEKLPAFLSLTYARGQDVESFNESLSDAFSRSNNDLEILWFIGFELETAKQVDFAFLVYQLAVDEIRKSLANGKSREDIDGRTFDEEGKLTEYTSTIEGDLISAAACTAEEMGSDRKVEFRRFYRTIFGNEPSCINTHNNSFKPQPAAARTGLRPAA
jgi:hypothetical protein